MKNRELLHHIWRAIEAQAKTVADSLPCGKGIGTGLIMSSNELDVVNEFELKRLRILIRQLEEESPN
ncbi:MAG: hypothetical protein JKY55_18415 [Aliivibrio sp.]|uniref:hypothetical protein n=1 Tax=Aliivibrio sp. TaxID=1872443 RepID=UPI001A5CEE03|nr:hypothetical protein [Aliivibrio sp.]